MPERHGFKTEGGWSVGNDMVNGNTVSQTLTLNLRNLPTPEEYIASKFIEFVDGFESLNMDEFEAYIADETNTPVGNPNGSGGENNGYRYGFNGMEKDDEHKGDGNSLDFGARIYDSRLGRWLSVDPLEGMYPYENPYVFCGANPIVYIDNDGKRKYIVHRLIDEKTGEVTEVKIAKGNDLKPIERVREVHKQYGPSSIIEYEWGVDWHDINIVYTTIRKSDGTVVELGPKEEIGEFRLRTTLVHWQWLAEFRAGDLGGGIVFTSSTGRGKEKRTGELADAKTESIDALMAAVGGLKTASDVEKYTGLIKKFINEKDKLKRTSIITEMVSTLASFGQFSHDATSAVVGDVNIPSQNNANSSTTLPASNGVSSGMGQGVSGKQPPIHLRGKGRGSGTTRHSNLGTGPDTIFHFNR